MERTTVQYVTINFSFRQGEVKKYGMVKKPNLEK
jgi:hypothetical protein